MNIEQLLPPWAELHRWRQHQLPVFEEIIARYDEGNLLCVLDGPCGSGKSLLAYMVHRYVGETAYYLVGTKHLQAQIAKSLPGVAVIKGKKNYTPTDITASSLRHDPTCDDCDRDERGCSLCMDVERCPYLVAREAAEISELPCANYKYALGEWSSPRSKFRHRDLVILDEADTLADELRDFVSVSVSPWLQKRFSIRPPDKKTVEDSWPKWFDYAIPKIEDGRRSIPNDTIPNRRLRNRLDRLVSRMKLITQDLEGWVYDYDTKKELNQQSITFKPVVVDKVANDTVWKNGKRFLAMSASIGSPEQFVQDLGFEGRWAPVFAPSTFDVARRPIYVIPSARMTWKTEKTETPRMAVAVEAALSMYPTQRVLVLPHTYKLAGTLYDQVCKLDRDIFIYRNSDEREEIVREFGECDAANAPVLFAPSLGRGYDNRDIDVVIICKVPYPFKGSKQVDKRSRMSDGTIWYANETSKQLIQNYGRVMRAEDDGGVTLILDSKFSEFFGEWRNGDGHRLFPAHFVEALDFNSDARFELRAAIRELTLNSSA